MVNIDMILISSVNCNQRNNMQGCKFIPPYRGFSKINILFSTKKCIKYLNEKTVDIITNTFSEKVLT